MAQDFEPRLFLSNFALKPEKMLLSCSDRMLRCSQLFLRLQRSVGRFLGSFLFVPKRITCVAQFSCDLITLPNGQSNCSLQIRDSRRGRFASRVAAVEFSFQRRNFRFEFRNRILQVIQLLFALSAFSA